MKAGQASTTAKVIAGATLLVASDPAGRTWVAPGAAALCRQFLATSLADRCLCTSATSPWTRWVWRLLELLTHPGIMRHYALRKRWIETQCRLALQGGVSRVIFSHMVSWADGRIGFRPSSVWVDRWLAWQAEPIQVGDFSPGAARSDCAGGGEGRGWTTEISGQK